MYINETAPNSSKDQYTKRKEMQRKNDASRKPKERKKFRANAMQPKPIRNLFPILHTRKHLPEIFVPVEKVAAQKCKTKATNDLQLAMK
jgi:hypothetical protein